MSAQLKILIEDLELNHEHCPKDVILKAAAELRRLYAEVESLRDDAEKWQAIDEVLGQLVDRDIRRQMESQGQQS